MIVKGIISSINKSENKLEVILPEYDNIVTRPFKIYREIDFDSLKVNDFVLVCIFNDDFNDCIIL